MPVGADVATIRELAPWADDALLEGYARLSPTNLAWLDQARRDRAYVRRASFPEVEGPVLLQPFLQQAWPIFIGRAASAELARLSVGIRSLACEVPSRCFADDPNRIREYFALDSPAEAVASSLARLKKGGVGELTGRVDLLWTEHGPRCVELNVAGRIGGWESKMFLDRCLETAPVKRFLERADVRTFEFDPLRAFFDHLIDEVSSRFGEEWAPRLNAGLAVEEYEYEGAPPGLFDGIGAYLTEALNVAVRARWPDRTGTFMLRPESAFVERGGRLFVGDVRIHAFLDRFPHVSRSDYARAYEQTTYFGGPLGTALGDKRVLALLSAASGPAWSEDDLGLIRAFVPWTRLVAPGSVVFDGVEASMVDLLATHRERFVLKPGNQFGGSGILIGDETKQSDWDAGVRSALEQGGFIAQERFRSLPFILQSGAEGVVAHNAALGVYVFGAAYGGLFFRAVRADAGGIVNVKQGAEVVPVVHVEE